MLFHMPRPTVGCQKSQPALLLVEKFMPTCVKFQQPRTLFADDASEKNLPAVHLDSGWRNRRTHEDSGSHPSTAGGENDLPGDPARVVRREKDGSQGDVIGLTDAAEWRAFFSFTAEFALLDTGCAQALRLNHARAERVNADLARAKLLRKRDGNGINRGFARAVDRALGAGIAPTIEPMLTIEPPSGPMSLTAS